MASIPLGMFDEHFLLEKLTKLKDPLVKLEAHIQWEIFAPVLDVVFNKPQNSSNAQRASFDRILMFKILILQSMYNLSDDQTEYQINDRITFKRFLGLQPSDRVPDRRTIRKFRETLIHEKVIATLFSLFNQALDDQCIFAKTGRIVDASFVEAPRKCNTREENKQIKAGTMVGLAQTTEHQKLKMAGEMTQEIKEQKKQLQIAQVSLRSGIDRQHRFIRMMSHEYRKQLAIMVANLDFIEITDSGLYQVHQLEMNSMRKTIERLVELMDISLKQSRLAAPHDNFQFSLFPATSFFSALLVEARTIWPKRNFIYAAGIDELTIFGDAYFLNQLMLNLLDNACTYSPENSPIEIDLRREKGRIAIRVVNHVKAMVNNDIHSLFEEFQNDSSSAETGSTGLGLWLVKEISERHHGKIYFKRKGERIEVSIYLPEKGTCSEKSAGCNPDKQDI